MSRFKADNRTLPKHVADWPVQLWLGEVGNDAQPTISLPGDVEERARRLRDKARRARFRAMQRQLRAVLSGWMECEPSALVLGREGDGKSFLTDHPSCALSWSHSDAWLAVALTEVDSIGVDVQLHGVQDWKAMLDMVASPDEADGIGASEAAFYRHWCLKEAVAKADGRGLGKVMRQIVLPSELVRGVSDTGVADLGGRRFACVVQNPDVGGDTATLAIAIGLDDLRQASSTSSTDSPDAS